MLNFIMGTAGTGKSRLVEKKITELAKNGEKCLYLVPEQFSQTGEYLLFSSLGERRPSERVRLFSFTSLLRDVSVNFGAPLGGWQVMTGAQKAVAARRARRQAQDLLDIYRRPSGDFSFSFNIAALFDDFKRSGITPEILTELGKDENASPRLRELGYIYSRYKGAMGRQYADREDLLRRLAENLPFEYTDGVNVFIDGFESFSAGQTAVIARMARDAKSVTVALTRDGLADPEKGTGTFSFVKSTAARLVKRAAARGVKTAAPTILGEPKRFKNPDLMNIDRYLRGLNYRQSRRDGRFFNVFPTGRQEIYHAAAVIRKLVKKGLKYSDIALVCPQMELYEGSVQQILASAEIPFFIDRRRIISSCAPVMLIRDILLIMGGGVTGENIISLLKTGLTSFGREETDRLENYLYVWQNFPFDFSKPFELPPSGLSGEKDEDRRQLESLNRTREKIARLLLPRVRKEPADAGELLRECWQIARALGRPERCLRAARQLSEDDSRLLQRQWRTAVKCLDGLYEVVRGEKIRASDLSRLFMLRVEGSAIGFAPETRDCVTVTDPKRMKLDRIKAVILIGAAESYFPARVRESRIISDDDRQYLREKGCPLKNNFENLYGFENLYFYKTLTRASDYLYISYSELAGRERQRRSRELTSLVQALKIPRRQERYEDYALTKEFFADYTADGADSYDRLSYARLLQKIGVEVSPDAERVFSVSDKELIQKALGDRISVSPTREESWYSCSFMYFLRYLLKVKPWEKAEFSPRLAGDYLHYIARRVMSEFSSGYRDAPWEEIQRRADRRMDRYLEKRYPQRVMNDASFSARHENMRQNARRFLKYLQEEQRGGLFRPVAFEERIGMGGRIPPLRVDAGDGKSAEVRGIRDRIDVYRGKERDYLRIVDYKSGNKSFDLDEVYNGLSGQLLLYMAALQKAGFADRGKGVKAGAVIYQNADRAFRFDKDDDVLYTAVGMALDNREIGRAFDVTGKARFGVMSVEGAKVKSAGGSRTVSREDFDNILAWAKEKVAEMTKDIYDGSFDALPLEKKNGRLPCEYCPYAPVCLVRDRKKRMEPARFPPAKDGGKG